jgi:hypothetical protein
LKPKRRRAKAPDRYLTHDERMAVRTSKRWVAGYPQLVAEWHPTRNVDVYPYEVTFASRAKIWWKCANGPDHEWQASPAHRTDKVRPQGCPFCAGKRVSITNSLATLAPDVAADWHPRRNGSVTPRDVTAGTLHKAWWRCNKGHNWQAPVVKRVASGTGCPKCAGSVVSSANSLARRFPRIAREWHPTMNAPLGPADVSYGSKRSVWWVCPEDPTHEYAAPPNRRTSIRAGCPYCSGQRLHRSNSLATHWPAIAAEWHPTRNGRQRPTDVTRVSAKRVWWRCRTNPRHVWAARVCTRTASATGCPICARETRSLASSAKPRAIRTRVASEEAR